MRQDWPQWQTVLDAFGSEGWKDRPRPIAEARERIEHVMTVYSAAEDMVSHPPPRVRREAREFLEHVFDPEDEAEP